MTRRGFMRRLVTLAVGLPVAGRVIARRVVPVLPMEWRPVDYMGEWRWIHPQDSWLGPVKGGEFPRGVGETKRTKPEEPL